MSRGPRGKFGTLLGVLYWMRIGFFRNLWEGIARLVLGIRIDLDVDLQVEEKGC